MAWGSRIATLLSSGCDACATVLLDLFVLDLLSDVQESVLYVMPCSRTGLKERHIELASECLALCCRYNFSVYHVSLVAYEHLLNVLTSVELDLAHPVSNVIKTVLCRAIICKDDSHCSFVIGLSDGAETFLACGVPNLQLHILSINLYCFDLKINSYKEKLVHKHSSDEFLLIPFGL